MGNTVGPIVRVPPKEFIHGMRKSEIVQRIADGTGSMYHGFLTSKTGMPEDNPMTAKGHKIMANMKSQYGAKKAKKVFYASRNKGTIKGVD